MHKFPGFIVLLSLVIFLSACSLAADITPPPGSEQLPPQQATQPVNQSPVYPIVPPDLVNGAVIYNQECAPCHGLKGRGDGPQSSQLSVPVATLGLSDFSRLYTPADWYKIVTQGDMERFMPAFVNLTDRERWDVVAYAMTLSVTDDLIAEGGKLFQVNCTSCHGKFGKGDGSDVSSLSTEPQDFTDQSFMAQKSSDSLYQAISSGKTPDMPAYANSLMENERWALVAYLRNLTYAISPSSADAYPAPQANTTASDTYPAPQASPNEISTQSPLLTPTVEISPTSPFIGTVAVQLINGSGGDAPSDAMVTLYGFDNMQIALTDTLSTGVSGIYTFTNVYMPEGRVFMVSADYDSGTYGSDIISVNPATPNLKLPVTVYESTSDISSLTTDRVHIFFDFTDPQNVQVIEVFIISNSSKQAVVAPTQDGTVVTFPLPQGYTNLEFRDGSLGERYVEVAQGFADRMTVNPGIGNYQVIFAFRMPYNRKLDFVQPMFLPTSAVVVFVPENGVKVESSQLQDGGISNFQDSAYRMYDGSSLIAGSSLEFNLSGRPKDSGSSVFKTGTVQNLAIGLGMFGLVLLGIGVWLFRRNQLRTAMQRSAVGIDSAVSISQFNAIPEDVDTLMDAIIALDDQYHAGNLPEEAYLERRAVLKDKLRELAQG